MTPLSFQEIGTSTIQSRAEAALCGQTYVFLLPGSTGGVRSEAGVTWLIWPPPPLLFLRKAGATGNLSGSRRPFRILAVNGDMRRLGGWSQSCGCERADGTPPLFSLHPRGRAVLQGGSVLGSMETGTVLIAGLLTPNESPAGNEAGRAVALNAFGLSRVGERLLIFLSRRQDKLFPEFFLRPSEYLLTNGIRQITRSMMGNLPSIFGRQKIRYLLLQLWIVRQGRLQDDPEAFRNRCGCGRR